MGSPPQVSDLASTPAAARVDARRPVTTGARWRRRKARGYDRPRFLYLVTGLTVAYLFLPIVVVVVFSFNERRSLAAWGGFSLRWYRDFLTNEGIQASLFASLQIALGVMVVAAVLGTLMALGLKYARSRFGSFAETLLLLTLVAPELATAVAGMLLFTQLQIQLSLFTVALGHVTFSIVFVALIVRSRLAGLGATIEEAALDLGCTPLQAVRLVTIPLLWPAIMAGSLLVFVISFDNFVTSYFLSGLGTPPLPITIYSMIKFGISPTINAVGTFMMALTVGVALLAVWLYVWGSRRVRRSRPG
jgi:ABC-type spermidine/putrescine transport system permease subunit II